MTFSTQKRDLLTLLDLNAKEITDLLSRAAEWKRLPPGKTPRILSGRALGLFFEKSSTRTRVSFEAAASRLGGQALFFASAQMQLSRGELLKDTVRVLSRYLDGIVVRTFRQETLEEWSRYSRVPVINGLTDLHHPCQILGDLMTIQEKLGTLRGRKIAYIGDGNNIAHSLMEGAAVMGMRIVLACPSGYQPDSGIVQRAGKAADKHGGSIEVLTEPSEAVQGADVLYTDVWTSMGREDEQAERFRIFQRYRIDAALLRQAASGAIVMHCLPAHRGEEVTEEVFEGAQSVVWDQAENRLYVQMALLELLLGDGGTQ